LGRQVRLGDLLRNYADLWQIAKKNRRTLGILLLSFTLLGLLIGILNPKKYEAEVVIAIEDDDSSGWQNLLQQFGIDVGGNNPGGIFKGESLVQLFMTRTQVERTLLREAEFEPGKREIIANRYLKTSKLSKKDEFKGVQFTSNRSEFTPLQDSLLYLIYKDVSKSCLDVSKPDQKLSIIHVNVKHQDKFLAQTLALETVWNTSDFYIELLTKKARNNLKILERESDSVRRMVNKNMLSSALQSDDYLNINQQVLKIDQNKNLVDLQINVSLYGELIKNVKLAEIGIRKETPLIQIVDTPQFPLEKAGFAWWQWGVIGLAAGFLFSVLYVAFQPTGSDTTAPQTHS
jgi:uncharacterized protein involved in exopolysaccharide biosynthesis